MSKLFCDGSLRCFKQAILPAHLKQQHQLWQVFKANRLAMTRYQPQSYIGQLIWFGASDSRITASQAVSEWQALATGGIETYTFPGDHYSLLQEPTVKLLAEKLRDARPCVSML